MIKNYFINLDKRLKEKYPDNEYGVGMTDVYAALGMLACYGALALIALYLAYFPATF